MNTSSIDGKAAFGVWVPALTPLDSDLAPDKKRYVEHVKGLLDAGCHGVAIFGTTGEANSFSVGERKAVLEAVINSGVPGDRLMVGTGMCALTDTVELTSHALSVGCRSILMLPPFYFKEVSDEGIFRSYAQVIDRVADSNLRIILYHFPKLSGVPITPGLIERLLAAYPETVVGIKDSSSDWNSTKTLINDYPSLAVFPGSEALLLQGLKAGGVGCITATANVNATAIRGVFEAWLAATGEADMRQEEINRVRSVFDQWPMAPALKAVLADRASNADWSRLRPPLMPLEEDERQSLFSGLAEAGLAAAQPLKNTGT